MDFKTNEGVIELFKSINSIGNENCFFVTFKDSSKEGAKAGALGAVGGLLGAASSFANGIVEGIEGYDGLLINQTERGLAIIPLRNQGVLLTLKFDKMEPQLDKATFIPNENIKEIIVKNFNIFNKKMQKVKIILENEKNLHLLARITEPTIPYQESNFAKFMNKYKK